MTIKRRLFISNILMIAVPIVLFSLFAAGMSIAMIGVSGSFGGRSFDDERFFFAKNEIEILSSNWNENESELIVAVDNMATKNGSGNIDIRLYKDGEPVSFPATYTPVLKAALEQSGAHMLVFDHTAVFAQKLGAYHIVLTDTNYYLNDEGAYLSDVVAKGLAMFAAMIAIIFFTNRILTRRMVKSIVTPLDTLSYGVEQVRDGNLDFRLDYLGNDEFSPVCAAFNEMARRLQNSEDARTQDEESRKELIAGISHDLRTPLTAIKAYLEGIEKGVAQTPEHRQKYFDTIKNKTEDLEHIINQLFLFSKLETNEFPVNTERVNIGRAVAKMIDGISEEYAHKGLSLNMEQPVPNVDAQVDMTLFRSVISNVLENSVKYKTAEIGKVSVCVKRENDDCVIRISDNGPGVQPDALSKLFDVFYRADPSRSAKGSGLGLAIGAKIMKRMGGGIIAELPVGGGLAICLRLPIIPNERAEAE
jgi:signal transduction histidine kinase